MMMMRMRMIMRMMKDVLTAATTAVRLVALLKLEVR
jgi:hypothetical protein